MDGLLTQVAQVTAGQHTDRLKAMDEASFGIIYGAVTVLSLLMSFEDHPSSPVRAAVILFGSVAAILMSKAFAAALAQRVVGAAKPERGDAEQ